MKISRIIFKQEQPGGGILYRAECTDVFNNWKEQYKSSCVAEVEAEENPVVYTGCIAGRKMCQKEN